MHLNCNDVGTPNDKQNFCFHSTVSFVYKYKTFALFFFFGGRAGALLDFQIALLHGNLTKRKKLQGPVQLIAVLMCNPDKFKNSEILVTSPHISTISRL